MLIKFGEGGISLNVVDHNYEKQKGIRKSYTDIHRLVADLSAK